MTKMKLNLIEQFAEDCKSKIGRIYTSEEQLGRGLGYWREGNNREVTIDGITTYVDGVGDINSLYRDLEYAKKTRYRCVIAPPFYISTVKYSAHPMIGEVPPEIRGYYSGATREWFRPLSEGDKITYKAMEPSNIKLEHSRFAGQKVVDYGRCDYFRQGGELVAAYEAYETWVDSREVMSS